MDKLLYNQSAILGKIRWTFALFYDIILGMRNKKGQFVKGYSASKDTQFKKGQHWRKPKPFWNRDWLYEQYIILQRSSADIAKDFGCADTNIQYFLKKFGIERRTISEIRSVKHWGQSGTDNPMWNKRGELNPHWLGGITAERQSFYQSAEWKDACKEVWKRDKATCQRCGIESNTDDLPFHIHHIISFSKCELRANTENLVLLCEICHHFIHSKKNDKRDFIMEVGD